MMQPQTFLAHLSQPAPCSCCNRALAVGVKPGVTHLHRWMGNQAQVVIGPARAECITVYISTIEILQICHVLPEACITTGQPRPAYQVAWLGLLSFKCCSKGQSG